ncbi:hypothetical protein CMI37_29230 [Candidatus Pacearchaeota archaeon]|nr:hypothetical protein [Candidatus Pacearchaeota archaeon]
MDYENIKFTHVLGARSIPEHIKDCLEEQPARSGMYNWIFAFKGEINTYWSIKDKLHEYDVIQCNMSPADMPMILMLRDQLTKTGNTKTKLVINNDYVCECWGDWGLDPYHYDHVQRQGDMVFGTEPHQVSNMLNGVFVIPHPTNTSMLKKLGSDMENDSVGFIFHWWSGDTYLPHRTLERVKEKFGVKMARIFAYKPDKDQMSAGRKLMWDETVGGLDFPDFAEYIQGERCVYDPNPCHTYGRNGVELACWGRPVVGSNRVFSYNMLFPELTCDPYDFNATMDCFDIVFNQPEKLKGILDRAYEKVEYFNYENSRKRFLDALKIAVERGGHTWYAKHG